MYSVSQYITIYSNVYIYNLKHIRKYTQGIITLELQPLAFNYFKNCKTKKCIMLKTYVLFFSETSVWNIFRSSDKYLASWAWYAHKNACRSLCKMFVIFNHILTKKIALKLSNIKFTKNSLSGSRYVTRGQADRQMWSLQVHFYNLCYELVRKPLVNGAELENPNSYWVLQETHEVTLNNMPLWLL